MFNNDFFENYETIIPSAYDWFQRIFTIHVCVHLALKFFGRLVSSTECTKHRLYGSIPHFSSGMTMTSLDFWVSKSFHTGFFFSSSLTPLFIQRRRVYMPIRFVSYKTTSSIFRNAQRQPVGLDTTRIV